jgi:hypothetical protein
MGGIFDYVRENLFLDSRRDDFVPLRRRGMDDGTSSFGPGPLILLYSVPSTMLDDDELLDMIEDGMPSRRPDDVVVRRISGMMDGDDGGEGVGDDDGGECECDFDRDELLALSVGEALERAMTATSASRRVLPSPASAVVDSVIPAAGSVERSISRRRRRRVDVGPCPVLYFSGVTNDEMMDTYRIIANEIYAETDGAYWPACAIAVPNAMDKSLSRVIREISEDHADAMRMSIADGDMRGDVDGGGGGGGGGKGGG